jgi:hypothetical protein
MPKEKPYTLDQFVAEMKQDLERFAISWRKQNAKKPEHWPMEMNVGDWYDQFLMFEQSGDPGED